MNISKDIIFRFKTEAEFIEEFGESYNMKLYSGWNYEMDPLAGQPIDPIYNIDCIHLIAFVKDKFTLTYKRSWNISLDMIKYIGDENIR